MNPTKEKSKLRYELQRTLDGIIDTLASEPLATTDDLRSLENHMNRWGKGIRTLLTLRQYDEILNNEPDE